MRFPRFSKDPEAPRRLLFTDEDKANIRWFVTTYLKEKTPWLGLVMVMILIQGGAYQQFIALTEDGLRVIFDKGEASALYGVCAMVLLIFTIRGIMSYCVPRLSVWLASDAVFKMRRDLINHLMTLDLAYLDLLKVLHARPQDILVPVVRQVSFTHVYVNTLI